MVMATPFLVSLRQYVEGEIWGIGKPSAIHLYNGLRLFDRFLPYDGSNGIAFLDLIADVRRADFQRGVALPHSFRSAFLLSLGYVKERIGYGRNVRSFLLNRIVREAPGGLVPTVEHYLRILDYLDVARQTETPTLKVTDGEDFLFDSHSHQMEPGYVVFIAGAQYGPSKRWPDAHFSALADLLIEKFHTTIVLLPGKGEEPIARRIREGARLKDRVQVKNLDIREMKVCISRASLVISNDTGPRHIAVALGVPTVVILGPMDDRYTVYPNNYTYSISKELPCRPCNKKQCDRNHECLKAISPEEVMRKAEEVLHGAEEVL
jgi:heptosyltransferase II